MKSLRRMLGLGVVIWGFFLFLVVSNVFAQCSIQDRIDLAKSGYQKVEIEELCAGAASLPDKAEAQPMQLKSDPVSVLRAVKYDGSEDPALGGMWHPRNKCEFLHDQVRLNNVKKTFGGYKSIVIPYSNFWADTQLIRADRDKGFVTGVIHLTSMGVLDGNENCYAMLDRRVGVSGGQFDATKLEVQATFKQVLEALGELGVDLKEPQR